MCTSTSLRSGLAALVVVALGVLSGACSGGAVADKISDVGAGPSPTTQPAPTPAPRPAGTMSWNELPPLSEEAKKFILNHNINTQRCAPCVSEPGVVKRWEKSPIAVYAEGFSPEELQASIDFWRNETGGRVIFAVASSKETADIVMDYQWPAPGNTTIPEGACGVEAASRIVRGVVTAGAGHYNPGCGNISRMGLTHGLGHMLVIGEHTDSGDIMSNRPVWSMTPLLREIVIWLYSVPPGTRPV